jgi:hypothetical protein
VIRPAGFIEKLAAYAQPAGANSECVFKTFNGNRLSFQPLSSDGIALSLARRNAVTASRQSPDTNQSRCYKFQKIILNHKGDSKRDETILEGCCSRQHQG